MRNCCRCGPRREARLKARGRLLAGFWLCLPALVGAADHSSLDYYGVLDMRGFPAPQVVYESARLGARGAAAAEPVYLRVPRLHGKQWPRYCRYYRACDRPAYFVSEEWYIGVYLGKALPPEPEPERITP